jgi:anti-sigma B factor antagonist
MRYRFIIILQGIMEGIDIKIDRIGALRDIALFRINGYVDTTTSPELQKSLTQSIDSGLSQYVIDMSSVHYVSSAGWGVFVGEIRNLRESGGDLKIIQMTPEVIEVFEMLEFNRILSHYDSTEEAVDDFDYCRGLDFNEVIVPMHSPSENDFAESHNMKNSQSSFAGTIPNKDFVTPVIRGGQSKSMVDADLPLTEKVKIIVVNNPKLGVIGIRKTLFSPRFGYTKVRYLKLKDILKRLDLATKEKRFRYFRSR